MNDNINETQPNVEKLKKKSLVSGKRFKLVAAAVIALLLIPASYAAYAYAASPEVIRNPKLEHYHFRMQIVVNGQAEDFSTEGYQTGYAKDQCNANLPEQPIHFHDNIDQFTHIHWEGMTGGMVMKYYGWNYIGGINNALGYKLDDLGDIQKVTTHGNYLPELKENEQLFVYTGDENSYLERSFADWKDKDLEEFFGVTSNFPAHEENKKETSFLDTLMPKAQAHGGIDDGADGEPGELTIESEEERLTRINNMIGNVVIFAQKDKPSDEEIKARFNDLQPLTDSTCGG
jgi:opacity protein-like surface antigen